MKKDTNLGSAFLDIALAGVVTTTIAVVVDAFRGGGVGVGVRLLALAALTYGAYIIGAIRVGSSPLQYLRQVGKRGSLPR